MREDYASVFGDFGMTNAASVKDRLKNEARKSGKTLQECLTLYGLERTIYRISISKYADQFTLKGGIFLYALFEGEFARATRDIDLLAQHIPNDTDYMNDVFHEIFSLHCDDALTFDLDTLKVTNITEFKEYHGVSVSVMGHLDRTRVPVSIDIGFGDSVYPERVKMQFPVMLDMPVPDIYAYSIYSVIAEKFEAIVSLGNANSRYKDFYDIYILAKHYNLEGKELREAVCETFKHRKTGFDDIVAFEPEFMRSEIHQTRWKAFLKKKEAMVNVSFSDAITLLQRMLNPIVESIRESKPFKATWNSVSQSWI